MELYIWSGDKTRGLETVDLESLQILAYIKFSRAQVTIHKKSSPHLSPCGILPAFICDNTIYTKFSEIITSLRQKNFCCEYTLTPRECADALAYQNMLLEKLHPAVIYLQWVEPQTYFDITRKWYFENESFPYKFWVPGQYYKQHKEYITAISSEDIQPGLLQSEILADAMKCLSILSDKLNENDYFFGKSSPTTLDACIYSYLILILKCGTKVKDLKTHIDGCPNLVRFIENVNKKFFPLVKQEPRVQQPSYEFPNSTRNYLWSALVAAVAMFGYGVAAGLVQVDMRQLKDMEVNQDENYCG